MGRKISLGIGRDERPSPPLFRKPRRKTNYFVRLLVFHIVFNQALSYLTQGVYRGWGCGGLGGYE